MFSEALTSQVKVSQSSQKKNQFIQVQEHIVYDTTQ